MRGTDLMVAMREGSLSCERTVAAFSRRSRAIGNEKHKAVTQEFYDEAIRQAADADAGRLAGGGPGVRSGSGSGNRSSSSSSNGSSSGGAGGGRRVLEGMPISVKDSIHMEGAVRARGAPAAVCLPLGRKLWLVRKSTGMFPRVVVLGWCLSRPCNPDPDHSPSHAYAVRLSRPKAAFFAPWLRNARFCLCWVCFY